MSLLPRIVLSTVLISPWGLYADTTPPAPSESQLVEHGSYINKDGILVHSPAHTRDGKAPVGRFGAVPRWQLQF